MSASIIWAAILLASIAASCVAAAEAELKAWNGGATPVLVLNDPQGKSHDLAAYRGSVVLVNFWATWCEPCRDEMPSMQRAKVRLGSAPFVVLAVNLSESTPKVADFLRKVPLDFTVLLDRDGDIAKAWNVRGLPASFLIDAHGRIRYSLLGETDWAGDRIVDTIRRLLQSG